jgi:putative endonuclease
LQYFVYVLRSIPTGKHYIGIAADVEKRLIEHNTKTGRWTSAHKPWEVIAVEAFPDRAAASRRERFLKSREGIAERRKFYEEGKACPLVERP